MNTCYFCRGDIERAVVDYMAKDKEGYVLVQGLPVERCKQCHEIYLDPPAARAVEAARKHRIESKTSLVIPVMPSGLAAQGV